VEVKKHTNSTFAGAKRWPRPLIIEVSNTAVYWQINRDFKKWSLDRGRTVLSISNAK